MVWELLIVVILIMERFMCLMRFSLYSLLIHLILSLYFSVKLIVTYVRIGKIILVSMIYDFIQLNELMMDLFAKFKTTFLFWSCLTIEEFHLKSYLHRLICIPYMLGLLHYSHSVDKFEPSDLGVGRILLFINLWTPKNLNYFESILNHYWSVFIDFLTNLASTWVFFKKTKNYDPIDLYISFRGNSPVCCSHFHSYQEVLVKMDSYYRVIGIQIGWCFYKVVLNMIKLVKVLTSLLIGVIVVWLLMESLILCFIFYFAYELAILLVFFHYNSLHVVHFYHWFVFH